MLLTVTNELGRETLIYWRIFDFIVFFSNFFLRGNAKMDVRSGTGEEDVAAAVQVAGQQPRAPPRRRPGCDVAGVASVAPTFQSQDQRTPDPLHAGAPPKKKQVETSGPGTADCPFKSGNIENSFIGLSWILPSFYWVVVGLISFYWVILGST